MSNEFTMIVTERARLALDEYSLKSEIDHSIPTVAWATDIDGSNGSWGVGLYDRADVPEHLIFECSGIEFALEPHALDELRSAVLDYKSGKFHVDISQRIENCG